MKHINIFVFLIIVSITHCKIEEPEGNLGLSEGFCIQISDDYILKSSDIEYYDFSTHFIFLNETNSFLAKYPHNTPFKVFADKEEIYSGIVFSQYSSLGPAKSLILHHPGFYPENIISIEYLPYNTNFIMIPDIRNDERIINALKKENKYHAGLMLNIDTIENLSVKKLRLQISLTNNDSFNYYIIDPDKIEIGLLRYYTNGLIIQNDINGITYLSNIPVTRPEPHDKWDMNWMSLINNGEKRIFAIDFIYSQNIPEGVYLAKFQFPTFKAQIERDEIIQENGRIWLGNLYAEKEIMVK